MQSLDVFKTEVEKLTEFCTLNYDGAGSLYLRYWFLRLSSLHSPAAACRTLGLARLGWWG